MRFTKLILTVAISAMALFGDYVGSKSKYSQSQLFRVLCDNCTHAGLGLLSALLFFAHDLQVTNLACVCNVVFCAAVSSLIDIDHVFVARSFYLKDMTNLKQRGIFHCTTFWLAISSTLLAYSYIARKLNIYMLNWMLVIAFTSHHIRDANRRGLWMYPFGHTPPVPTYLYVFLLAVLPHVFAYLFKPMEPLIRHTVVHYKPLV